MSEGTTAGRRRIVAVSNRVASPSQADQAVGGLAVGVLGALEEHGGIWFGWNGDLRLESRGDRRLETEEHGRIRFVGIDLDEADFEGYYNGFSNKVLWPLLHYLLGFIRYRRSDFEAYLRVNATFAHHLVPLLGPDDVVWVHDYHLIPLGAELRRLGVEAPIGFFLHVPFPGYDVLQALPDRDFILKALCAYDVVGFQTGRDLASFRDAVTQPGIGGTLEDDYISIGGRRLATGVYPIGVDVDQLLRFATEAQGESEVTRTLQSLGDRQFIIGVDRLDYSKGLEERFHAYARLLEKHPETHGSVSYTQIAPPTRIGVRAYEEIRASLEQTTGAINGRFATLDWVPLKYINSSLDRRALMGLLRLADVGLVTPIRDGMNLVAKEFVAAQDPRNPGVLVLSELAGASFELGDAVLVNPYDVDNVADGIQRALTMPLGERRERHRAMMAVLRKNDIVAWRDRFVDALLASRQRSHDRRNAS